MKTQRINSNRIAIIGLFFTLLMATSSCGNKQSNTSSTTPAMDLHAAAFMGNVEAIQQHIDAGSDLNVKDEYGSTPLTVAITFGKTEAAKMLIEAGADINAQTSDGSTALHAAALFCRTDVVESLLAHGIDKSIQNNYGSTALQTVSIPFENLRPVYDQISKDLGPMGLKLDYDRIENIRPVIAEMLR